MVITVMSTTDDSESGESHQSDELTRVKEKLKVQQRLIDISARNLQSTRLSSRSSLQHQYSSSSLHSTSNGYVSGGEGQSSLIEENLREKETKLMRGFSRQLLLKHLHLKQLAEDIDESLVENVRKQLDELISLEQFLNVTGIEPKSIKALLTGDNLTLDGLFSLTSQEVDQLFTKRDIASEDRRRLLKYLEILTSCYESWESRDHSSVSGGHMERYSSTTSRLGSLGSFDQEGVRTDSMSSCTSCGNSPRTLRASTSHTPTPLTPSSAHAPTPVTPSSSHSLLSPGTFTYSTPVGGYDFVSVSNPQTPNYPSSSYSRGLNRQHSSSSSVLLESPPYSLSQTNQPEPPQLSQPAAALLKRSVYSHKRSKSNPPAHSVSQDEDSGKPEQTYVNGTTNPHISVWNRSSSPPSRAGSNPSITSHSVYGPGGSPSSIPRGRHPQMKRISGVTPAFSQTISNDQLIPTPRSSINMSGSESALCRQNTCPEPSDLYPRSYSLAGMVQARRSMSTALYPSDMTSTSMVDLPVRMHAISSEHLDQIDEYGRPDSNKSRSVPKLTFMTVSMESEKGVPSTSAPTSPRTPGTYTPTGHMGHAIKHRFVTKTITPHVCDYCKKTVMIGVRCKHCKYKCHKACSNKVPNTCGLPPELMDFFRKQVLLTSSPSPSVDSFVSPTEPHSARPSLNHVGTTSSLDMDTPESPGFVIHELSKEPSSTINFSPVMGTKKYHNENGRQRNELVSQTSTSSLLEVPNQRIPGAYRSTSSSPSVSPPTSPSLTPSSPRSPVDSGLPVSFSPPHTQYVRVVLTDESGDEAYEDHMVSDSRSESPFSSRGGSTNDISDMTRLDSPQGLRPPPQVVMAQSLPDLLNIGESDRKLLDSRDSTDGSNVYVSDDILGGGGRLNKRKESLVGTLSTADSKTSTLVNSNLTEEDSESDSDVEEYRRHHRPSMVDEWDIPYEDVRLKELISRGPVAEVHKGYWHGEVAIKRFLLPDATPEQILKFKEEVAVLKKTRHENLALFMGASVTAPNLAIVTSFCKGQTLYRKIHVWGEPFSVEKSLHIANQVAQAMGYLHARNIVHKDLNTKNIFLEKGKVVITDTGLSNLTDTFWLQQPETAHQRNYLIIPRTKLYYLAPEIIHALSLFPEAKYNGDFYPYSEKTDVYAFGTVLYELLVRKFPFSTDIYGFSLDPMSVIFQVGRGRRPDLQTRDVPKRIKDLLLDCMHFDPKRRFPFSTISEALVKLSRKKTPISRSPSFPISLSRSSETINFL